MNRTGDDFMELVCENGQILVRGRSGTISCIGYLSHSPKTQFNNGIKDNHPPKRPRLVHVDSISGDESFPAGHKEPTKQDSFLQDNHNTIDKCQKWPRTSFSIFLENMRRNPCDQITEPRIVPLHKTTNSRLRITKSKMELPPDEQSEAVFPQDVITRKQCPSVAFVPASNMAAGRVQAKPRLVKNRDYMAAANSTCSREASTDPTYSLKCKRGDIELPAYPSEDDEEQIQGKKKSEDWRSRRAKRKSREIHNLSEKRRRDKINKRLHALKDLLPSSSKVGKASVLDETIEYVKTLQRQLQLQLQFQMVSTGTGLFMSPAMFTSGMQSMQTPYLAQMSAMAMRMHMGVGCRPTSLVSSSPVFGLSGQRMPFPVPQPPFFPSVGRAFTHSIPVPGIPGIASVPSLSLKGSVQIGSSKVVHNGN